MRHLRIFSVLALSTLFGCAEPPTTEEAALDSEAELAKATSALQAKAPLYTRSADRSTYGIYSNQNGQQKMLGSLKVSSRGLTLSTSVAADLSKMSIIVDFDGLRGRELQVFDVKSQAFRQVETEPVLSAAWSADGTKLAYSVAQHGRPELRISDGVGRGATVSAVKGQLLRVLGWSNTSDALYVSYSPEIDDEASFRFARVDLPSGAVTDVLVGNMRGNVLSDFRLVTLNNGRQAVSFIRSGHVYGCSEQPSSLVLAGLDGQVIRESGETLERNYLSALWSPDAQHVAFMSVICPPAGEKIDLQPLIDRDTGVFMLNAHSGRTDKLVAGIPMQNTRIEYVDGNGSLLSSAARGVTASPQGNTHSSEVLDANRRPQMTIAGYGYRNNWAQYIHQYYDTKDGFNGWWACGPTSSVMSIASYILPQKSVWSSLPTGHSAPYSGWITEVYSWGGTNFNRYWRDASYRTPGGAGAYGWHMDSCDCTHYWRLSDWLGKHIGYGESASWAGMEGWVRTKLNESAGRMLISAGYPFGRGHVILVKGYNDDGSFIFHDPAGYKTTNAYNGANVSYWWSEIGSQRVWWD